MFKLKTLLKQRLNMYSKKLLLFTLSIAFSFMSLAQDGNGRYYSAGEIQSKNSVLYGRIEMMMYCSGMSGTTSTFFMWKQGSQQANERWNELDIESFGKNSNSWQSNPIWEYTDNDTDTKRWEQTHTGIPIADTWVKFTLEWTPGYLAWFNNDVEVRRIVAGEDVPSNHFRYNGGDSDNPVDNINEAMRVCFNHWATFPGDWLGPFNPAELPSYQFVDWFKYSPWNGNGFDTPTIEMDFNSLQEVQDDFTISTHTFGDNQCTFTTQNVGVTNGYLWLSISGYQDARPPQGNEIPGGTPATTHIIPGTINVEEYAVQSGFQLVDVNPEEGSGKKLGWTDPGDYATFLVDVEEAGDYKIDFRVASLDGNASFTLSSDNTVLIDNMLVNSTGGWTNWETIYDTVYLEEGEQTLRYEINNAGVDLYRIDISEAVVSSVLDKEVHEISIFPNPATSYISISKNEKWKLYNSLGSFIKEGNGNRIDLLNLQKGLYFVYINEKAYSITVE